MNAYEELQALFYKTRDLNNSFHVGSEADSYDCRNDDDTIYDDDDADCVCG